MHTRRLRSMAVGAACPAVVAPMAGCGGSKPAVCQDRTTFQNSLKSLQDVSVRTDGLSALRAQISNVKGTATNLVNSAKKQYAPQSAALKTAVTSLGTTVEQAGSAP